MLTLLVACTDAAPPAAATAESLRTQVSHHGGASVSIADAAPFSWDRLYIFGPYTPAEEIRRTLQVDWKHPDAESLVMADHINLLVFVDQQRVISSVRYPRSNGDFVPHAVGRTYTRDEAVFAVEADSNGWLLLRPAA